MTRQPAAPIWLFGYGSLIYKVDFPFLERRRARIHGWTRRFWQGSHDHRGTPEAPGRVVTLIADAAAVCTGMAYRVTPDVFAHLDHREKNGYTREAAEFVFDDESRVHGVVYVANPGNEAYLGPAAEAEIARHIAAARGPSGENRDYLLALAQALRELDSDDAHVFGIERELRGIA
jgi:glutathione-specific gamma-glutamylcyclotransferase